MRFLDHLLTMILFLLVLTICAINAATQSPAPTGAPGGDAPITPPVSVHLSTTCPAGYRCGTCPNGDWWSYLDDGSELAREAQTDPKLNGIFDTWKPCG